MNSNVLSHLIDETKKWIEDEFFDQKMINIGGFELKASNDGSCESVKEKSVSDLFSEGHFNGVEVVTLIMSKDNEERTLIDKLTHAIDTRIAKAKVVEVEFLEKHDLWGDLLKNIGSLRHILVSEMEFYKLPNLLKHYQTRPVRSLLEVPLFFLSDLKSYNRDISLKKSLWATLLSEL